MGMRKRGLIAAAPSGTRNDERCKKVRPRWSEVSGEVSGMLVSRLYAVVVNWRNEKGQVVGGMD